MRIPLSPIGNLLHPKMSKTIAVKRGKVKEAFKEIAEKSVLNNTEMSFADRLKRWKARDFSWSQISSFEFDPEQWYRKYFLKEEEYETEELKFGKMIGEKLASDPNFLPEVPRLDKFEHCFRVVFGGITLIGYADGFCTATKKKLDEYKTGVKEWTQKRADEHGQFDMYLLMHYITEKIKPEDVELRLVWLPTERREDGDFKVSIKLKEPVEPKIFKTKRTMSDILNFGARINRIHRQMEVYAKTRSNG